MNARTSTTKAPGQPMGGGMMGRPGGAMMMGAGEKAKNFKGTLLKLAGYLKPFWVKIAFVIVFAIASTVFTIVTPRILGNVTNGIVTDYVEMKAYDQIHASLPVGVKLAPGTTAGQILSTLPADKQVSGTMSSQIKNLDLTAPRPGIHFDSIFSIAMMLVLLYVLSAIFSYIQGWIMSAISQTISYNFRRDISSKINRLPLRYFDTRTHGEVLSRVTNDVDTVSQSLNQSLTQIITSVITIIGILVMMLSISWLMTLVAIILLPVSFGLIAFIVGKSQKFFKQQQDTLAELNGHVEEMFSGHNVVRVFGGEKRSVEQFQNINKKLYGSAWRAQFLSGLLMPLMNFVGNLGYVGVSVLGGWLAVNNKLQIGDIQAFIQYVNSFNQPIVQTAQIANVLQSTAAAAERVFEFLEEEEEAPDTENPVVLENVRGEVEFDNVVFGYDSDRTIIKGFSAHIKPGQRVAIVGPTGAGKTTMVNLLMRFYEINSGAIKIDGVDIRDMRRADVRRLMGMVLQDTWLFNGTIRENIAYGNDHATPEELLATAKSAHVDHFVHALPKGYDLELNEEADNISQGEKQLLTIARAMLAKTPILILDEATSSVDTRTEVLIQKAMDTLMKDKTSFVIAHRLSTIREADLILVMRDGNIVEQGTHHQLLANDGFYASLYNSQFTTGDIEG